MLREVFAGETVHVSADDLTMIVDGVDEDVTTGATVTIRLYRPDGTQEGTDHTGLVTTGNNWGVDFDAPTIPMTYIVKASFSKDGANGKLLGHLRVEAF